MKLFKIVKHVVTNEIHYIEAKDIVQAEKLTRDNTPTHKVKVRETIMSAWETYESERHYQMSEWQKESEQ